MKKEYLVKRKTGNGQGKIHRFDNYNDAYAFARILAHKNKCVYLCIFNAINEQTNMIEKQNIEEVK